MSDQVEGHGEYGLRGALKIDLAAGVGALVDGPVSWVLFGADDLLSHLRWGQARVGQESRKAAAAVIAKNPARASPTDVS